MRLSQIRKIISSTVNGLKKTMVIDNINACSQARRQKIFQGGQRKKDRKLAKNTKNSTI